MRDPRLRKEIHGLLLGAAAGMGFAALETSGYGFVAFVQGLTPGRHLRRRARRRQPAIPRAHAAGDLWPRRLDGDRLPRRSGASAAIRRSRSTRGVVIAFLIAVGLHGLWDFSIGQAWLPITIGNAVYPGFDILIVGPLGLLILGFFLREAHSSRRGSAPPPPPPPPLDDALKAYFNALFSRFGGGRPAGPAQPYGTPVAPYPRLRRPGPYPPQAPGPNGGRTPPRRIPSNRHQRPTAYPAAYPPPHMPQGQAHPQDRLAAPHWPLPQHESAVASATRLAAALRAPSQPPRDPFAEPHPLAHVPYCARCGITYPPGATICTNCGSPLTEAMGQANCA